MCCDGHQLQQYSGTLMLLAEELLPRNPCSSDCPPQSCNNPLEGFRGAAYKTARNKHDQREMIQRQLASLQAKEQSNMPKICLAQTHRACCLWLACYLVEKRSNPTITCTHYSPNTSLSLLHPAEKRNCLTHQPCIYPGT